MQLPEIGYLRIKQIIGDPRATPPIPAIIPVCKTAWYAGCKSGKYPKPVKLAARTSAWKVEEIRALIASV
jgi:hypothetical protein